MHCSASHSITQPLLDCILSPTQNFYHPGTLSGSANQYILGNMYLGPNLPRKLVDYSHDGGVDITPFVCGGKTVLLGRGELGHCLGTF